MTLLEAEIGSYDIWEATVTCYGSGGITQIKSGKEILLQKNKLVRHFTNYFGIGTDARITYLASQMKAENILFKKISYGIAGFLSFWLHWDKLNDKICSFKEYMNQK